jgi:general secretion pathway protein J
MMRGRAGPGDASRAHDAGFTMLEVLVTLAVLGVLLATLVQGLRVGLQARTVGQRIGSDTATLEPLDRVLRELLSRASPADPLTYDRAFTGTSTGMAFTTTIPEGFGTPVPLEADVTILVIEGHRLVLRWRPHHSRWTVAPAPPATELLLDGVAGLRLGFFQPVRDGHGGRWLTSWSSPELPRLVRIRVKFAAGDRRNWPDIVAATPREGGPS